MTKLTRSCPSYAYPAVASSALLAFVMAWIVAISVVVPSMAVVIAVGVNQARAQEADPRVYVPPSDGFTDAVATTVDESIPTDPALDARCHPDAPTCVAFLGCLDATVWRCEARGLAADGSGPVRWGAIVRRIDDVDAVHRYLDDQPDHAGVLVYRWDGPYVVVETSWYEAGGAQ